jgi:cystathionine beta-lyase
MDFPSPPPILDALRRRVAHTVFGYSHDLPELKQAVCRRLKQFQHWDVEPEAVVLLPGLVCGLNVVCRAIGDRDDGVLVNTPVYPPFLTAPRNQERRLQVSPLACSRREGRLYYEMDFEHLESTVTTASRLFILCNPQNPTGRTFSTAELTELADFCEQHDLVVCSDEIHCDLLLGDARHTALAALAPEVAKRTITLMAPSKTFNTPGLGCSMAIITDAKLRSRLKKAMRGIVPHPNLLGMHAALAAYQECEEWRSELLRYLTANRDFLLQTMDRDFPEIGITRPEATYLAWLDCRRLDVRGNPSRFFLERAGVAFNDGRTFGEGGQGFVRLNFGCPRGTLKEALERMRQALCHG